MVAVCCSVSQCVAVCCGGGLAHFEEIVYQMSLFLFVWVVMVAVCCGVLRCVVVCCSVWWCVAEGGFAQFEEIVYQMSLFICLFWFVIVAECCGVLW